MTTITINIIQQQPLIFTLDNVFDDHYCQELINESESKTYEKALITIGENQYKANPNIRNNDRIVFENKSLAESLFAIVQPFLPTVMPLQTSDELWELIGLNARFRYYCYSQGQQFKPHFDGYYQRNKFTKSFLTLMFYLNDDFTGGATTFFKWWGAHVENDTPTHIIQPKKGQALVFQHKQLHEGSEILMGTKYVLRTDVMYRAIIM